MGLRGAIRRAAAVSIVAMLGCVSGTPHHFPSGNRWTLPLVGPLEGGPLIVPVYVQDAGPYLMVIDPDSQATVIDDEIAKQLDVPTGPSGRVTDDDDVRRQTFAAEVLSLRVGDLTIGRQNYWIMKAGTLKVAGRDLRGVIGRDIIDETLVFGFDRERGVAWLTTGAAFTPPTAATKLGYDLYAQPGMVGRRMIEVSIGERKMKVHVDIGEQASHLRESLWEGAGLTPLAAPYDMRDDGGTLHHFDRGGLATRVTFGGISTSQIVFAPYADKRWDSQFIDGTIALDVLRRHNVWADWYRKAFYLVPRGDESSTVRERIARWKSATLDRCVDGGCATMRMLVPAATGEEAKRARPVVMVERDASSANDPIELVVAATGPSTQTGPLPRLIVNLPAGATTASTQIGPEYAGTQLAVVDASPYPRTCPRGGGCIDSFAP